MKLDWSTKKQFGVNAGLFLFCFLVCLQFISLRWRWAGFVFEWVRWLCRKQWMVWKRSTKLEWRSLQLTWTHGSEQTMWTCYMFFALNIIEYPRYLATNLRRLGTEKNWALSVSGLCLLSVFLLALLAGIQIRHLPCKKNPRQTGTSSGSCWSRSEGPSGTQWEISTITYADIRSGHSIWL